jgi:NAD(P)-dependent dehydrogenase (short-subunit alcohol dehydrogenase family)
MSQEPDQTYKLTIPGEDSGPSAYVLGARAGYFTGNPNIGDAIAQRLSEADWTVTVDDASVGNGYRPRGGNIPDDNVAVARGYTVTEQGRYRRYEAPAVQTFEQVNADALIVTCGRTSSGHFSEIPDYEIGQMVRANLVLPLEAARRFIQAASPDPNLSPRGGRTRHIVFIGSYGYEHPFTEGTLYCAAKAGLDMAARTLGWELTDRGYRVHIVHPYHVGGTPMWSRTEEIVQERYGMTFEEADAYNRKDLKMPDLLTADEIADVVHALLTVPAMGWLSGQSLKLYGGTR